MLLFFDKKFVAENFYTTNVTFNEYEETQNSLLGVSTTFKSDKFKVKPRIYWRRGQDMFLLRRDDPGFYRNFHITNKIGIETNASYTSDLEKSTPKPVIPRSDVYEAFVSIPILFVIWKFL